MQLKDLSNLNLDGGGDDSVNLVNWLWPYGPTSG